jgi:hypothetical protein
MRADVRRQLSRVRGRLRGLGHRRRGHGPPILVYQMGKVGSSTVYRSLLAAAPGREVFQVHLLHDLDAMEAAVRTRHANPSRTLAQIERGRKLRARVDRSVDESWNVITLTRDPVQRNVSAFFENLTELVPDAEARRSRDELTTSFLRDVFLDRYEHSAPLTWFPAQLEPVFGVDVYATRFDAARGTDVYESPRGRLLLIRLEDLGTQGVPAIREFLGLDRFSLVQKNISSGKSYAGIYEAFGREIVLPDDYLDRMYDSQYARHFYTDSEIDAFRRRWTAR